MSGFARSRRPGAIPTVHVRACRRCASGRVVELIEMDRRPDGPALSVSQVCYLLALSQPMVREMIKRGEIQGARVGTRRPKHRVPWRPFRAYLFGVGMLPLRGGERK